MPEAVVVGAGPNGLSAAVTLAEAGMSVRVLELASAVGGGSRSAELTIPDVIHDVCSAVHPMAAASPAFAEMTLQHYGLSWCHPEVPLAHPLDDGSAAVVHRDLEMTAGGLGSDSVAYRKTFGKVVEHWDDSVGFALAAPLRAARRPIAGGRFGLLALQSVAGLARGFQTERGRALVAGLGGHAIAPFNKTATAGVALTLGAAAHTVGWPFARGGSQSIADALAARLRSLGGTVELETRVAAWSDIPPADIVMFDTDPAAAVEIAGEHIGRRAGRYQRYSHGPAAFKIDVVTSEPIPWTAPDARRAGTLHLGGTYREIATAESDVAAGDLPDRPFVIAAQPTIADPGRAPEGLHVLWAYGHVPFGCEVDITQRILDQVERFAPGFRDTIVAMESRGPAIMERHNPNIVGGDIAGGAFTLRNVFARPTLFRPYRAARGIYLCSSSTPPGAGVHGMCGRAAARAALRETG